MTPPEAALFHVVHYGMTISPASLASTAACPDYCLVGTSNGDECRTALTACLAKGWLQIIDEVVLAGITAELRAGRFLGPVYGLPNAGEVDFTHAGADLWRRLSGLCWPDRGFFAYPNVVHDMTAYFFSTEANALAAIEKNRNDDDIVSVTGPVPIGPWRAEWWRRFPSGYRVDIEQRWEWQGCGGSGTEDCCPEYVERSGDLNRLRSILDSHNVTLWEWLLLKSMELSRGGRSAAGGLCEMAARVASELLGLVVSEERCREGLDACLRYRWLRLVDERAAGEVRTLLGNDPVFLALPKLTQIRPSFFDEIDFSPAGARLFRMILAEWLGPACEDDLSVSRSYYWEEHLYCEAKHFDNERNDGFSRVLREHDQQGDSIQARRIVPIGPWCVYWWKRFPSGYRLELKIGEP